MSKYRECCATCKNAIRNESGWWDCPYIVDQILFWRYRICDNFEMMDKYREESE